MSETANIQGMDIKLPDAERYIRLSWKESPIVNTVKVKWKCSKGHISSILGLQYTDVNGVTKHYCDVCICEMLKTFGISECEEVRV